MKTKLTALQSGDKGKVAKITAGKTATKRLYEMGLNTNAFVQIIKNDAGPVIVSINGNKVALGRGLAEKVKIEKVG